jgi:hypothetical protein
VADGVQPDQFTIGDQDSVASHAELDPTYRRLLDDPSIDERRVLFELKIDRVATFGRP